MSGATAAMRAPTMTTAHMICRYKIIFPNLAESMNYSYWNIRNSSTFNQCHVTVFQKYNY